MGYRDDLANIPRREGVNYIAEEEDCAPSSHVCTTSVARRVPAVVHEKWHLQRHPPIVGLVVGRASRSRRRDAVHELQREVGGGPPAAAREWRGMGSRSYDEAYGMFLDDVRALSARAGPASSGRRGRR